MEKPNTMDSPEKAMAPHSNTLAWKIPWTEEPGGLQSMGSLRARHDWTTSPSFFTFMHWRSPLQGSCLENPRDGGAWWAAIYGVAQSRTRLRRLSSSSVDSPLWISHSRTLFVYSLLLLFSRLIMSNSRNPMDCSTPGLPVPHHLLEFAQVRAHCIGGAIQPSHSLTPTSPSALNLSQHREISQWVSCSYQVDHNTGASASASVLPMSILFYIYCLFYIFLY